MGQTERADIMAIETDDTLAGRLASAAGDILLKLQTGATLDAKALGKAGDEAANAWLMNALASLRSPRSAMSCSRNSVAFGIRRSGCNGWWRRRGCVRRSRWS